MARQFPAHYCLVCGTPLVQKDVYGQWRAACPACDYVHFEDPKVAVLCLLEREGRILLTRRAMNPARGKWTVPGGFVDAGEDPRDAAVRECMEETALRVEITHLIDLYYGKAHIDGADIVILYGGRILEGTPRPGDDADALGFFSADELPELAFESTHQIVAWWVREKQTSRKEI